METLLEEKDEENNSLLKALNKVSKENDSLQRRVAKGEFNPETTRVVVSKKQTNNKQQTNKQTTNNKQTNKQQQQQQQTKISFSFRVI